ncbi:MAG: heavy-metal-associated domain-containing protein [Gammaproteobacteria bacterium]|nr:heavy-metal-associated domain-containing protein [Gammaproteobacteria bacterium]
MMRRVAMWLRVCLVGVMMIILATPVLAESRDSYHVHVTGLACPFCVYGLERSIGKISGVDSVAVDLKTGLIRISMSGDVTLDEAVVRETIKDAGFTVEAFEPAMPIALQHDDGA